ncbi:amidohydrolase family protein [Sphingomonas crocodyli]|nr:amidohydrolase family protein [Sphingomonas crocodyli]
MRWWQGLMMAGAAMVATGEVAAKDLLISNVTLIDGTGAAPLPGASVLVSGDRIALIAPGTIQAPAGAMKIDGTGKYLLPGLIDSHIHLVGGRMPKEGGGTYVDKPLAIRTLQGFLNAGVTSVYDSGNNADFIFEMRADERAGKFPSPRIFAAGAVITAPGGYGDSVFGLTVSDVKTDRAKLQAQFDRKPDLQKILFDELGNYGTATAPVFSEETFAGIIKMANSNGIPTTVHAASESESAESIDAGIDGFAHPVRSVITDGFAKRVAAKRIPVSTTMAVFYHIATIADHPEFLETPLFKASVDPAELQKQRTTERQRYINSGMAAQFKIQNPYSAKTIKKLFDNGVILTAGTDRTWGASLHMELDLLAKAGIPLLPLTRIATLNGAIYLHKEKDLGSIERGKLADLLLLNADPTKDVAAYGAIAAVFKNGEPIEIKPLDTMTAK